MKPILFSLLFASTIWGFTGHPEVKEKSPAVLMDGLGDLRHPVSTKNAEAQKFFDQGLRLLYAFNHDEARRSFQRASELDPQLAMAYWGMALAVGPNYNLDANEAQLKDAAASMGKALELAKNASDPEKDYILALARRYSPDPKKADKNALALAYALAMGDLAKRYPDDLDAATLFAEAIMNLRPWELWTREGRPADGTFEALAVLESVLKRNPDHIGACHLYIHAIEASPFPERGLPAADRLAKMNLKAGHLVHMPAHIYQRVGDFASAARANQEAAKVDRDYIQKFKVQGVYPMMYYSHNLHFLAVAHAMQGRYQDAKSAAEDLARHVGPYVKDMPMLELFLPTPTLIQVRFQKWDDILENPAPDMKLPITLAIHHFARGLALTAKGEHKDAAGEHRSLVNILRAIPDDMPFGNRNLAKSVLVIPAYILAARLAVADKDIKAAIGHYRKAIDAEDDLRYIEPADWHIPVREYLGGLYLRTGAAAEAEKMFRADLLKNPRNPRSLFGLMESLKSQRKTYSAQSIRMEYEAAWRNADVPALRLEDL